MYASYIQKGISYNLAAEDEAEQRKCCIFATQNMNRQLRKYDFVFETRVGGDEQE